MNSFLDFCRQNLKKAGQGSLYFKAEWAGFGRSFSLLVDQKSIGFYSLYRDGAAAKHISISTNHD